nr:terminase small subunit [Klebsiella pneumoniae]
MLLNKRDMAASLGISVQAFDRWGVKPVERRGREVLYDVRAVLDNRLAHQEQKSAAGDSGEEDYVEKRQFEAWRLTRAQADAVELDNQKKTAEVVDTAFSTYALGKVAGEIAGILDSIPLAMQRRFPELDMRHTEFLRDEIIRARNKAASIGDMVTDLLDEYIESTT